MSEWEIGLAGILMIVVGSWCVRSYIKHKRKREPDPFPWLAKRQLGVGLVVLGGGIVVLIKLLLGGFSGR